MSVNKRLKQAGATLVEFATGLTVFLLLVFGSMQLCLNYFAWNRVSEAARDGARYLAVNNPLIDLSGQNCGAATPAVASLNCSGGSCGGLMGRIQAQAPFVAASQVHVSYMCSATGNSAAPDHVRDINLTIAGSPDNLVINALAGLGWSQPASLPTVSVTRTGETLHSLTP